MQQGGDLFREVEAVEEEEKISCSRDREVISLRRWRQRRRRWRHKRRRSRR